MNNLEQKIEKLYTMYSSHSIGVNKLWEVCALTHDPDIDRLVYLAIPLLIDGKYILEFDAVCEKKPELYDRLFEMMRKYAKLRAFS